MIHSRPRSSRALPFTLRKEAVVSVVGSPERTRDALCVALAAGDDDAEHTCGQNTCHYSNNQCVIHFSLLLSIYRNFIFRSSSGIAARHNHPAICRSNSIPNLARRPSIRGRMSQFRPYLCSSVQRTPRALTVVRLCMRPECRPTASRVPSSLGSGNQKSIVFTPQVITLRWECLTGVGG